ncbi:membrane-flanked domain protein [Paenibacillus algicola]|uniref:Membrane-flanked domain protein n=1 Tax=Paenibacillus algicola TaxID=2565926 RepID=A0A4P8XHE9_9BACL|nr:PH domain-containing protein [Paenibacillus algicola]QCT01785.1 membrane-flanked domain protein [Paenibacillus algicola]
MSELDSRQRLHRWYILFPLASVIRTLLPALALLLVRVMGDNPFPPVFWLWSSLSLVVTLILLLLYGWRRWRRFTYELKPDKLLLQKGVWFREEQSIYIARIHSVHVEQPLLQRLLGLAQIKIETSGKNEDGGKLPAISKPEARKLQLWLQEPRHVQAEEESSGTLFPGNEQPEPQPPENQAGQQASSPGEVKARTVLLRVTPGRLLLAALTSSNFSLALAFLAAIGSLADDLLPDPMYNRLFREAGQLLSGSWITAAAAAFILAWLLSAILYTVQYAGFTVERAGRQIIVTRGLLERKELIFSPERVQAVTVKEGLLRQPFRYSEVRLHVLTSGDDKQLVLHPMLRLSEVNSLMNSIVPQFQAQTIDTTPPRRALWLYIRSDAMLAAALSAGCIWIFEDLGLWSLLLLPLSLLHAIWAFRDAGMSLHEKQLTLRTRRLARHTRYVRRPQVVSFTVRSTRAQRKRRLRSFHVSLLSSQYDGKILGMEQDEVERVRQWFMKLEDTERNFCGEIKL